ncbi:unnamed protein product [Closterium sp. NIES-54]
MPLSTVECKHGFSRKNVIKSWVRGSLGNARLAELMVISLLDYEIDWSEALAKWREKARRPAKTPVFAAAERKRKGKDLAEDHERERVARGLEWDREESDEDYDEEAYDEDQAQDDPFREEDEGEDVEEIAMDQP